MRVLVADDDKFSRNLIKDLLQKWGYEVIETDNGEKAWQLLCQKDAPRLVLLDWVMPGLSGIELCQRLRQSGDNSYYYIILLTSRNKKEDIIRGLDAGADDYVTKPFVARELEVRLRAGFRIVQLQQSLEEALVFQRHQAQHDPLTRIFNYGAILNVLEKELERSQRQGTSLSVLMGDLDNFKKVNDSYGHMAGDAVLVEVARRIKKSLRRYDAVGRYGGEEFLVVLPDCNEAGARQIAVRLLKTIKEPPIVFDSVNIHVTISLGLAVSKAGEEIRPGQLLQAADSALYRAKKNGRNRVEIYFHPLQT